MCAQRRCGAGDDGKHACGGEELGRVRAGVWAAGGVEGRCV